MIKVENIDVWGFEHAVRAARNPMNSWDKSDSLFDGVTITGEVAIERGTPLTGLGKNDVDLMRRLYKAGPEHRKYLRQIFVSMDITAPTYWNAEFDTYKIGVTRNSCSFMHKGVSKEFDIHDFSISDERVYDVLSPIKKTTHELNYPYETNEYREYIGENGRRYRVFKNGRIIAEKFEYTDTMGRVRTLEEKECIPSKTASGYYEINIGGTKGKKWQLHRLVATVWIDNPEDLKTVNHKDGDKGNNCVENLEWKTLSDNIKDGFENGLFDNIGSLHSRYLKWKNGHKVVSPHVRKAIIDDHNNGIVGKELADKYQIVERQANNIVFYSRSEYDELFLLCYAWENTINTLNELRNQYLTTKDSKVFQQIRCLLPCGYNQRYTVTMNYENVVNIIKQRSGHRLAEWREFVNVLKELPYVKEIMNDEV